MPIDQNFQEKRAATTFGNLKVWKDNSSVHGIYGTNVAVDLDLCVGDGACIEVCPTNVFDWKGQGEGRRAIPTKERDCIYCFGCEAVCPKFAISVSK